MLLYLILLLTIVPAVELALLIHVHGMFASSYGSFMGLALTIGSIVLTGIVGANLARQQGFQTLRKFQQNLGSNALPGSEITDGALILFGAALLLTPGYLTDAFGFSLLLPMTRPFYKAKLGAWVKRHVVSGTMSAGGFHSQPFSRPGSTRHSEPRFDSNHSGQRGEVIDAEILD